MDDTRDKRDPQKLGELYLNTKDFNAVVEDYPQNESLAMVTAREYRAQLEERAREGQCACKPSCTGESKSRCPTSARDKYAVSALESINTKGKVEGFDDAGS